MAKRLLMIPARMNSTRLPRKLSLDLAGETVLGRTLRQGLKTHCFSDIVLATDSRELASIAESMQVKVMMTPSHCSNGSERCSTALKDGLDGDVIVVLQGDEPFIDPLLLDEMALAIEESQTEMVSVMHSIDSWMEFDDPSVIKVVCNREQEALYFSRSPIPSINREAMDTPPSNSIWGHIGVYGYKRSALLNYPLLSMPFIERAESLEQLRALSLGWRIKMLKWTKQQPGINTLFDLENARARMAASPVSAIA